MERAKTPRVIVGLALLLAAGAARAQALTFVPVTSIYEDDKKVPLRGPEGVACTSAGIVVADTGNGRLLNLAYKDGGLSGGTEMKVSQLPYPTRVQSDSKGSLLVLDRKTRRIVRLDRGGTFVGFLDLKGPSSLGVVVPGSFQLDSADNVYVLDLATLSVLVADPAGNVTRQVPLPRQGMFTDVAVDAGGTIYVSDGPGAAIWSADRTATSFKPLAKDLKDAMSFPGHIVAVRGRLFVSDQNGHGIVLLGLDGSYQGRQLGIGAAEGFLSYPSQVCVNDKNEAFVADRGNNRVQVFAVSQ